MAGYPYLSQVMDPNARAALKAAFDQITALTNRIVELEATLAAPTAQLNANGHTVGNVADPLADTDAVNLKYLRQFVAAQGGTFPVTP